MSYATTIHITVTGPGITPRLICGLKTSSSRVEREMLEAVFTSGIFTESSVVQAFASLQVDEATGLDLDDIFDRKTLQLRADMSACELTSSLVDDLLDLREILAGLADDAGDDTVITVYLGLE